MEYFLNEEGLIKVWDKTNLLLAEKMDKNASFALDGDKITGILPISKGGTGASDAATALSNLGVPSTYCKLSGNNLMSTSASGNLIASDVSGAWFKDNHFGLCTIGRGNGDGAEIGSSGTANIFIKSWYGVGFVDMQGNKGVSVAINCRTGNVAASSFSGSGINLTSLNAGNISSGTLAIARGGTGATDAATARANLGITDSKVDMVNTEPTTETAWYPLSGLTGTTNGTTLKNEGYRVKILQGTTSAAGKAQLLLGNNKATGTDGNKKGQLTLYSENTGCHIIQGTSITSNITHTFPAKSGTVLTTGNYPALTSCTGTLTVEKGGTGSATALGARQNLRIFYGTTAERDAHTAVAGDIWVLTD